MPVLRPRPPSSPEDSTPTSPSLPGAAVVLALALGALAWTGPTRELAAPALVPWTIAFLALIHLWKQHAGWLSRPVILLGGAVLLRVLFLLPGQDLSDDLFRYVWDGWIGTHGVRPYLYTPDDPALHAFQGDPIFRELNSPAYHSVYPPFSQLVFLIGGWAHEWGGWPLSGRVVRVAFTLLELSGIVALHRALVMAGRSTAPLALYAWNPLALVAVAGSGHSEGGLVLGLGLLLLGVAGGRAGTAWTGWVLAVLSKGLPILLAPLAWRAIRRAAGIRASLRGLGVALGIGALVSIPFLRLDDLPRAWSSAELYVSLFEFNAGLHALLRTLGWDAAAALRALAVVGALWIGIRHRAGSPEALARGGLLVFTLYLVTATTVHPWYLLWVLPLVPFTRTGRHPWLWGSWAAFPTYLVYGGFPAFPLALLFWGGMLAWWIQDERERFFRPLRRLAGTRKARWMAPWVEGSTLLDVGGAEGWVSGALESRAGAAPVVLAFDATPPDGPGPVRIRGDGRALPFPDRAFDTVLLAFVLHHVEGEDGPERCLREALRVASRRVVVLESTWEGEGERRVLRHLDAWVNARRETPGVEHRIGGIPEHRTAEAWRALATRLGARIVVADRPEGAVHRVLRLVLEPGSPGSGQSG